MRVALVGLVGLIVFVVFVVLMALAAEVVDVPGGALPGNGKVSEFAAPDALSADRGERA
ncbi:phosphoribosylglycinamide formyltransferase [Burkholderia thailandensis]|uniref:phosphoribosylglycinamide formyltransferase n=1 Tax=Burkholderia thailandensis TaxID=57975 RepID=UPI001EE4E73A|nr:phosphoribosylglycinamide formyltransferase [Burkholderia thailandensis]